MQERLGSHLLSHDSDRARVLDVAAAGYIDQQQVMLTQTLERVDIIDSESHVRRDRVNENYAHFGVIAGIALADVVQQRTDD